MSQRGSLGSGGSGGGDVTSVTGTANQVLATPTTGDVVLSLIGPYTPATYTAHGVLIGEGTSSISATATGSAGQVLQSGGSLANPAYSTASYPTTAGSSGNVITSDGTNFVSQAPASQFTPNSILEISEDFISNPSIGGNFGWSGTAAGAWITTGTTMTASSGHPGVITHVALTTGSKALTLGNSVANINNAFVLGGGLLTINWVFQIVTASNSTNRYSLLFGIGDTTASASVANGCWIQYSDNLNSGDWTFNTASASTPTNSNSSIAATTGWHNAQIVINAAASSVSFFMDGVSMGTAISTNIPTTFVTPFINIVWSAGTVAGGSVQVDLFYLTQILTTPR